MKIAIIAPSSVPFTIGGAENLWWGLLNSINRRTAHQADLIKLPSSEGNFWEIMDGYKCFSLLDLNHFDIVISGKYPSWMVQHSNHICYMLHRLRGLYDTYHFTGNPEQYVTSNQNIIAFQEFLRSSNQTSTTILQEFFYRLEQLRCQDLPQDALQFPGALAREIVHFLDGVGLNTKRIAKYAAISRTVANRKNYFPAGRFVEVIYPPSNLNSFRQGSSDYLFTVSRLDGPKRIRLLIEAMKHVKTNIQLKIAGTGPDENFLKDMAKDDERIIFLGFVKDQQLTELYADALAVPYVPYDEDYGLVVVEALMCAKPVLTTTDSGGPTEFIRNGETGYVVLPDPQALAERIDYLYEHRGEAQQMGLTGQRIVREISWEDTVAKLLGETKRSTSSTTPKVRRRITVALSFPVFPPRGGGQSRVFHLYRHLASSFDIELVTFTNANQPPFKGEIAPGLWETRIPKSERHQSEEWTIEQEVGVPISDIAMALLYQLTPGYREALKESTSSSDFVVACHPYLMPAIREVSNKPLWYEAQDVEIKLKRSILPDNLVGRELLEVVHKVESMCCQLSTLIMVCCNDDANLLSKTYDIDSNKIITVPNGVDIETVGFVPLEKRLLKKKKLGISGSFSAVFMGSWHGPNLDAVRYILNIARDIPEINFLILGSVCLAFEKENLPSNVGLMGVVDDDTKNVVLGLADVALNPVIAGSGTNLKMLDYFAAGVPVVSTPFGTRGLGVESGKHCSITELENFPKAILRLKREDLLTKRFRVESVRDYVKSLFNWAAIASRFLQSIT